MAARPTLKHVAEHAGVSFKTVSRVVNDEAGVSPAMAARVRAAIDELGYRRNRSAQVLRRADARLGTVAVVHADSANPFAAAVHAAFEEHLRTAADTVVLSASSHEDPEEHDRLVDLFVERQVDGLAVIPVSDAPGPSLSRELERRTPIVFIDREPGVEADVVTSDHRGGAHAATTHLLAHGHRRIAFLGSREHSGSIRERFAGFDAAIVDAGGAEPIVRFGLTSADLADRAVTDLLTGPDAPTALFAAQNLTAAGAVRALHRLGRHHDVALVAFDHVEIADLVEPGITTVPQNAEELGRTAAELLLRRIDGDLGEATRITVPVGLVARGSGEITP